MRGDQLTGGSRDVNPQYMIITTTQSGADTTTSSSLNVPIDRLREGQGKVGVIEILKVFWELSDLPETASAAEIIEEVVGRLTTFNGGTTNIAFQEPRLIASVQSRRIGAFTAAGTYSTIQSAYPVIQDLTDGAGHGILVATDSIFLQVQSTATSQSNVGICRIMYRFKNVSLAEYIGIVQSQQ